MYCYLWTWSCKFSSALGLAWQACLKNTEVELELLTDNDMFIMVEKGIKGGICQAVYRYLKQTISIWKIMIKTLNLLI